MAKFSELPVAGLLTGTETVAVVQNSASKATTVSDISTFIGTPDLSGYLLNTTDTLTGDLTVTGGVSMASLTSTGIDDNATSTALTLDSSQNATFAGTVKPTSLQVTGNAIDGAVGSSFEAFTAADIVYTSSIDRAGELYRQMNSSASSFVFRTGTSTAIGAFTALTLDGSQNATFAGQVIMNGIAGDTNTLQLGNNNHGKVQFSTNTSNYISAGTFYPNMLLSSSSKIIFAPFATTALTLDSSLNALFEGDIKTGTLSGTGVTTGANLLGAGQLAVSGASTGTHNAARFYNPNGEVGRISMNGTTTTFATSSDPRLKSTFVQPVGALDKIVEARENGYIGEFNFLSDPATTIWGYNAHALLDNQPGFGGAEGDGDRNALLGDEITPAVLNDEGEEVEAATVVSPAGVDQSKRVPMLEAAIYDLLKMNEALVTRIEILENK